MRKTYSPLIVLSCLPGARPWKIQCRPACRAVRACRVPDKAHLTPKLWGVCRDTAAATCDSFRPVFVDRGHQLAQGLEQLQSILVAGHVVVAVDVEVAECTTALQPAVRRAEVECYRCR